MGASVHVLPSAAARSRGCWSPGCVATAEPGGIGLCAPCEGVVRAAIVLYHALCARELERMEATAPGSAGIARRVFALRLRELAPDRALTDAALLREHEPVRGRPVIAWRLERLQAFVLEQQQVERELTLRRARRQS